MSELDLLTNLNHEDCEDSNYLLKNCVIHIFQVIIGFRYSSSSWIHLSNEKDWFQQPKWKQSYHNNIEKHPSDESGNEENSEDDESSDDDKSLKMEHFGNHMVMQSDINKNHHFYDQGQY